MSDKRTIPADADPEITISGPLGPDPDATFSGPLFDPDATVNTSPGIRRRSNPFAPKALPEALQANLAALGGLNPLVAFANPILSAIPQITASKSHPDPALLKETMQDLVEAFEAGASKSGIADDMIEGAVYALCCLADDSAASTQWGGDWATNGLLREMRDEANGGEQFFVLLDSLRQDPERNADLLEFLYICLALGFKGRYRNVAGGAQEVDRVRADLHALVTKRRPRPTELAAKWRGVGAAASSGSTLAAPAFAAESRAAEGVGFRWRAIVAGAVVLAIAFFGYQLLQRPEPPAPIVAAPSKTVTVDKPAEPAPPAASAYQTLEKELAAQVQGGQVALAESAEGIAITLRNPTQFSSGDIQLAAELQPVLGSIAAAIDRVAGKVIVKGYADSVPVKPGHFQSNIALSAERAKAAADLIRSKLADPARVTSEGAGEANPIAPNDTEENRAKNRRIEITIGGRP